MHSAALSHWLHLLWGRLPALQQAPADAALFIAQGHIHLPPAADWHVQRAAAAHAAAHLVYSPAEGFGGEGLVPIVRTLLATLEDARVEALAMRELPGLARLWRPWHTATPDSGEGFEALLQRLARALIDPDYDDPHAWVRKGRRLFYVDARLGMLALRTPAELRAAAMALGHDIGQARLPFNARSHRPQPAYRDDHRWMWPADAQQAVAPPPAPTPSAGGAPAEPPPPASPALLSVTRHPEWDCLIQRHRAEWVTVIEQSAETGPPRAGAAAPGAVSPSPIAGLLPVLRRLTMAAGGSRLAREGEAPDLDALVAWQVARREGRTGDAKVFRHRPRRAVGATVWLLVDQSASSADRAGGEAAGPGIIGPHAAPQLIDLACGAATALVAALRRLQVPVAVSGFHSEGRHAVRLHTVLGLDDPPLSGPALWARLQALRCAGSTRVGAVLRHTAQRLARRRGGERWMLLLSDAQAHDIDVHDPHYLPADAREAARGAARQGVRVACLVTLPASSEPGGPPSRRPPAADTGRFTAPARAMFGPRAVQALPSVDGLPGALRRLWA